MQYYYHQQLSDLDENGFGLLYLTLSNDHMPPHWHRAIELLYLLSGTLSVTRGGQMDSFQAGDLCLIDSYDIHESWCGPDVSYLCVHILPAQMCKYISNFDQLRFSLQYSPEDEEKATAFSALKANMDELTAIYAEKVEGYLLRIQSLLYEIVLLLFRYFSQPLVAEADSRQRSDITRLEPILDYMELHHGEDLSLEDAASAMGLNKEYFCRLFKKNMGTSYLRYLNQIRAAAVCRELGTSDTPISELAERHGFRNMKLFNQLFRETYGCTPSEKRKQLQQSAGK
ncbi:MAG: helix-turn-helix domain-containing protein [Candidatus Onthomonas sp.]